MVAKVGVVTTVGCPYCKKAKAALREAGVEYEEADLAKSRDILAKVKEVTGQRTVPQIFIGQEFIGGATELLELIESGKLAERLQSAEPKVFPDSIASLLASAPEDEDEGSAAAQQLKELAGELEASIELSPLTIEGKTVKAFTAAALSQFLQGKAVANVADTVQQLLLARLIAPLTVPAPCFDAESSKVKYQLTSEARARPIEMGNYLNTHIPWHGKTRSAVDVSAELRARILDLYDAHLSSDGRAVDYAAMAKDDRFAAYVDATAELQEVDIKQMSREETIAFFINVYNALIVHATVAHGTPATVLKRVRFFGTVRYNIGGLSFTADDIEHGILRSNTASPASLWIQLGLPSFAKPPLATGDARRELVVSPLDPRIHFALVCGAKSCPPIKLYTPDNLEEGLQDAAVAFCDGELDVDLAKRTLTLSMIFKWYGGDFGKEEKKRLLKWAEFCSGKKKEDLTALAQSAGKVHFNYKHYDWTPNSK